MFRTLSLERPKYCLLYWNHSKLIEVFPIYMIWHFFIWKQALFWNVHLNSKQTKFESFECHIISRLSLKDSIFFVLTCLAKIIDIFCELFDRFIVWRNSFQLCKYKIHWFGKLIEQIFHQVNDSVVDRLVLNTK